MKKDVYEFVDNYHEVIFYTNKVFLKKIEKYNYNTKNFVYIR